MKNFIVIGLDGAGKTTHARKLMKKVAAHGIKTRYVYARGYSRVFFALPLLILSRLIGLTKVYILDDGKKASEYCFFANRAFRVLWPWVSFIDSFFYSLILFHLHTFFHEGLTISDRSVIDTLVDIVADTQDCFSNQYSRYFLNLIPKNSIIVLLDVDEENAMARKKDVASRQYLRVRRKLYKNIADIFGWIIIDTSVDFEIAHNELLQVLFLHKLFT